MRRAMIVLTLIAAVAAAAYLYNVRLDSGGVPLLPLDGIGREASGDASTGQESLEAMQVEVTSVYVDNFGVARAAGVVTNGSDRDCEMVILRLTIADGEGEEVRTIDVRVEDIPSGQTRSFDVEVGVFRGAFSAEPQLVEATF